MPAPSKTSQTAQSTVSPAAESFDIRDPKNAYEPCPSCGATHGMGLTSGPMAAPRGACPTTGGMGQHVICTVCWHKGPSVAIPEVGEYFDLTDSASRDRQAFEAWNTAACKYKTRTQC